MDNFLPLRPSSNFISSLQEPSYCIESSARPSEHHLKQQIDDKLPFNQEIPQDDDQEKNQQQPLVDELQKKLSIETSVHVGNNEVTNEDEFGKPVNRELQRIYDDLKKQGITDAKKVMRKYENE